MIKLASIARLLCLGASLTMASCASKRILLEPVGPEGATGKVDAPAGRLIAFTARERYSLSDISYSHPTSYRIYSTEGKLVKYVRNNSHVHDSQPEWVSLSPGMYTLTANAEGVGVVSVPVMIESLKTTEVHLERGWKPPSNDRDHVEVVKSPKGEAVGWRIAIGAMEELDQKQAARADLLVKVKLVQAPDHMGTYAYSLVEPVMVLRNNTSAVINGPFTVGCKDLQKVPKPGISTLYLVHAQRDDGTREWRMVE